jgi:hypothetical protein
LKKIEDSEFEIREKFDEFVIIEREVKGVKK